MLSTPSASAARHAARSSSTVVACGCNWTPTRKRAMSGPLDAGLHTSLGVDGSLYPASHGVLRERRHEGAVLGEDRAGAEHASPSRVRRLLRDEQPLPDVGR